MAKSVATPHIDYEDMERLWIRSRAVCGGERQVKDHDALVMSNDNFLIPFSPTMSQPQYEFLKREAELPGVSAQFAKTLVGGLLRKKPEIKLPEGAPAGALDWITNAFGADDSPIYVFLDTLLGEEVVTSRPWIFIDYPDLEKDEQGNEVEPDGEDDRYPYPILYPGEAIINWRVTKIDGKKEQLTLVVVGILEESEDPESEFHRILEQKFQVHELVNDEYQVRTFFYDEKEKKWVQEPLIKKPLYQGKPFDYIPAWPANGNIKPMEPMLTTFIDKEVAIYNKIARRNHLLYGASTYTPYLKTDMDDANFNKVVGAGLGSWLKLEKDDDIGILTTPTEAIADLENSIAKGFEELAKLGMRMLSPETDQSGVALNLRNATQTAQLGMLNIRISTTMAQIICLMINWKYGTSFIANDIGFSLSDDFLQTPVGEAWVRLATEWYQQSLIPRSTWLLICKANDIIPGDYDDKQGLIEIAQDATFEGTYTEKLEEEEANAAA